MSWQLKLLMISVQALSEYGVRLMMEDANGASMRRKATRARVSVKTTLPPNISATLGLFREGGTTSVGLRIILGSFLLFIGLSLSKASTCSDAPVSLSTATARKTRVKRPKGASSSDEMPELLFGSSDAPLSSSRPATSPRGRVLEHSVGMSGTSDTGT